MLAATRLAFFGLFLAVREFSPGWRRSTPTGQAVIRLASGRIPDFELYLPQPCWRAFWEARYLITAEPLCTLFLGPIPFPLLIGLGALFCSPPCSADLFRSAFGDSMTALFCFWPDD